MLMMMAFLGWYILATLATGSQPASWYQVVKMSELLALCLYVVENAGRFSLTSLVVAVVLGTTIESVLAWMQFINQQSMGLWLFGERSFSGQTPGIALVDVFGNQMLRPYGTFSHPNVLAGYLVLSTTTILAAMLLGRLSRKHFWLTFCSWCLGASALFITFSRTGWLVGTCASLFLFSSWFISIKSQTVVFPKRSFVLTLIVSVTLLIVSLLLGPLVVDRFASLSSTDSHSFLLRQKLTVVALTVISQHPLFGVGPNNFLGVLPALFPLEETIRWIQPVHTVFLLIAAESGLVGLALMVSLCVAAILNSCQQYRHGDQTGLMRCLLMAVILLMSLTDHYFWTLQQGQLLFFIVLGLALSRQRVQ